jgi:type III pantothenate kinase
MILSERLVDMFIAIDIGNTQTVIGIYKKDKLLASLRVSSMRRRTEDTIFPSIRSICTNIDISRKDIEGIGISSVVPNLTQVYAAMAKKYFHKKPMIVNNTLNLGIKIHYDDPKSLGADRICSAIAGYSLYGGPLIIIDFGTATTYNVIASNGDYLGGIIAPGIGTSALALHRRTAQLPRLASTNLFLPAAVIGSNTKSSMQTGIFLGAIDAATGMVNRIQKELHKNRSKKATVIATGGFSAFVAEQTYIIQHVEPMLVLDGIRLIYDRVKSKKKR